MAEIDHMALAQNLVASGKLTTAEANEALKAHGINHTLVELAPPAAAAPQNDSQQSPIEVLDPITKHGSITAEQVQSAYENWIKLGFDPAKFEEAARADGFDLVDDEKTEAQAERDAAYGFEREHVPEDYKINYAEAAKGKVDPTGLAAFNAEATAFCADLQLDPNLAGSLIEQCMVSGQAQAKMTEAGRQLYIREQRVIAERQLGGVQQLEAAMAQAAKALKLSPSAFTQRLIESGALNDAWVFLTLANHGARVEQWADGYRGEAGHHPLR